MHGSSTPASPLQSARGARTAESSSSTPQHKQSVRLQQHLQQHLPDTSKLASKRAHHSDSSTLHPAAAPAYPCQSRHTSFSSTLQRHRHQTFSLKSAPGHATNKHPNSLLAWEYLHGIEYYCCRACSKEVWNPNFQQYGQMKSIDGKRQGRKPEEKINQEKVRRKEMRVCEGVGKSPNTVSLQ